MSENPFNKTNFPTHRDWKNRWWIFSCARQKYRVSNIGRGCSMVPIRQIRWRIAHCALLLSNLLENKPHFAQSAETLYSTYVKLDKNKSGVPEFEAWLHSDWLNVSRVANLLNAEMARDTNAQTSG